MPKIKDCLTAEQSLDRIKLEMLVNHYCVQVVSGISLVSIKVKLERNNIPQFQKNSIYRKVEKAWMLEKDNILRQRLLSILEVLELPEKFGIDKDHNIVTLYPQPVLNKEYKVIEVKYKTEKAFLIPSELFNVYCHMEEKDKKRSKLGRPSTIKPEYIKEWVQLKAEGYTYAQIASRYGYNPTTITYHVKKQISID